jgi:protocatechuate 3,4-dioxygenase beta subunit
MANKFLVLLPLLTSAAFLNGQTTDPKATDQTGNGPPAFVLSKGQNDGAPTKEEKQRAEVERPISGVVTDADGKPVVGAVVQLKNTKTLQVRSFITKDKGEYYFAGLNKDVDYEVRAKFNGHDSALKILSSFDTKPNPVLNLQIK